MSIKGPDYDSFIHYAGVITKETKNSKPIYSNFFPSYYEKYISKDSLNSFKTSKKLIKKDHINRNEEGLKELMNELNQVTIKKHDFLMNQVKNAIKLRYESKKE